MAVRAVLAKPPSKQVEVLLSESSNVNSGNEVIPVAEITMPQTILQQKSKKLPEERITQGDDGNTEYANVCGFFVHVKSLLRNNEIRRQLKPFIEEEIVDATEFKPSLPNNFQPLRRLKNGSINQPRIQQNLFAVNTFGDNKAINGKPEKRVKLKSILRKSHTILGHDLDFSTGDDSDVTEASKSTSLVNDDDIIIDKIYVNHKPKRLKRSSKLLVTPLVRDDPINSRQKEVITKFVDESFGARNELQSPNEVEKENKDGTSLTISASADPKKNCCIPAQPDMLHLNGQTPNTDTSTRNDEVILVDDECTQSDQSPKGEGKKCKLVGNEITIFRKKKHRKKPMKKSTITNITESANPGMIPGIQKEISKRDDRMEVDHHENVLVVEDHAIDDSSARTEIPSCSSASCTGTDEGASDTFRKGLNIIIKEETILPDDYGNTADFEITGINHDFAMLEHLRDAEDENNDRIELIPVFKEEEPWYDDHFDSGGEESSFDHHPPNPNFDHNGRNDALKPKRRIVRRGYRRRRKNVIINRRRKNVVTNQRHDPSSRPLPIVKSSRNLSACSRCGRMFGQEELSMHENLCTVVTEFSDAETQKCPMCPYETENKEKLFKHISYRHVLGNNKDCTLVKRKRKEKERSSMKEDSKTGFLTKYQRKQLKKMNGFKFFPKYTSKHVIKGYLFHLRSLMMVYCLKCNLQSQYHKSGLVRQDNCKRCEGSVKFYCGQCGEFFVTYSLLRIHVVESYKLMDERLCCAGCNRQNFVLYCNLRTHEMNCIQEADQRFRLQPYVRLGNCNDIIKICKGLPINLFADCSNCITTSYVLDEDSKCIHCELPLSFKCPLCRELCASRSSLREHLMVVHSEILRNCPKCKTIFQEPVVTERFNGIIKG